MQRLLELLRAYGSTLYFVGLQLLGLQLLVSFNAKHRAAYDTAFLGISGRVENVRNSLRSHFTRTEQNRQLHAENQRLRTELAHLQQQVATYKLQVPYLPGHTPLPDSLLPRIDYRFVPCRAIANAVDGNFNYLTLNVGRAHGIEPEMGVIATNGVVGMTVAVGEHFCRVISVLNKDFRLSARIRGKGVFGAFGWDGADPATGQLQHIPLHIDVAPGDTVEASGFSTLFPEGTLVGVVETVTPNPSEGFHTIDVRLAVDFYRLDYLTVVKSLHAPALDSLAAPPATSTPSAQ